MRHTERGGWPYGQPPNTQFEINRDSPQSDGLILWLPHGGGTPGAHSHHVDRISGLVFTEGGTPTWVADGERGQSLLFDDAASEYLKHSSAIVTAPPFTVTCWFNTDTAALTAQHLLVIGDDFSVNFWRMYLNNSSQLIWQARGAGFATAIATTTWSTDTWHHACAIEKAAADRAILLDAGSKGTNTGNQVPAGLDFTSIAARADNAPDGFLSGCMSDVRIYNRALTDTEIKQVYYEPWELYKPLIRRWTGWKSPVVERIPRYGFINFQVPGIV